MKLRITSNVQREIQEAAEYYEAERAGLGDRFWQEVDAHVGWILENPTVPRLRKGDYRRVNLHIFRTTLPTRFEGRRWFCSPWLTPIGGRNLGNEKHWPTSGSLGKSFSPALAALYDYRIVSVNSVC